MRIKTIVGIGILALSAIAHAQNCNPIVDETGTLTSHKQAIQSSVDSINNLGGDTVVHVYEHIPAGFATLDAFESNLEQTCPEYGVNGHRKNNLISILVATKDHKVGYFYGSAYNKALADGKYNDIVTNYMKPKFRDGDIAGGVIAGISQTGTYIQAANHVSNGPTVINNTPATDYSGLWAFMKWMLFFGIIGSIIWGVWYYLANRKKEEESTTSAQRAAAYWKNAAATAITTFNSSLAEKKALGTIDERTISQFDALSESYTRLANSQAYDINSKMTVSGYTFVSKEYEKICSAITALYTPVKKEESAATTSKPTSRFDRKPTYTYPSLQPDPVQTTTHTTTRETVYVDNSPAYTPLIIPVYEEPVIVVEDTPVVYDNTPSYPDTSYSTPDTSYTSSDSGSSSSWSDSSSSYDSGSSSSFDSGSSSDFSGGGDSSSW